MKYFFSEGMKTESGDEVSTREIKKVLSESIAAEDKKKPLTDEELVNVLSQKGYKVARRTVAKYREQLNIPIARMRKEIRAAQYPYRPDAQGDLEFVSESQVSGISEAWNNI